MAVEEWEARIYGESILSKAMPGRRSALHHQIQNTCNKCDNVFVVIAVVFVFTDLNYGIGGGDFDTR